MLEGGAEAMSNKIDQRIVEMSFENHKFEKGILESKNSLKEFSNALKNTGTGKSFNGLEDSIGSISRSFSMMEQIGIGALRRIGEMAVNAGSNLVKSLSVDQLTAGLSKYQQKIEAVQTMVSAGYDFEEVEKSMQSLMWFSDETSYSFSDMAGNMAKFIAAGVDLHTSEKAMKGIATWAAHSGKNTQAASIAMFNLSQAISMGYVDTRNWYSIMNQNMNTKMFKQIAIGVAEATGAIKKGQVTIQNFDTNLKEKWFTNDVLLKTLEQYGEYAEKVKEVQDEMDFDTAMQAMDYMDEHADKYADILATIGNAAFKAAQESKSFSDSIEATKDAVSSGWLRTYEIIFGTLNEAKANFSALTEILWQVFASGAESRNELLQDIKELGGISDIFQTLKNTAIAILKPLQAISRAFDSIFPPKTAEQWAGMISSLKNFTGGLIVSDETADKLQRTFRGLFSVLDLGLTAVKFLGSAFLEIIKTLLPVNTTLLDITANLGDFLFNLKQNINGIDNIGERLSKGFRPFTFLAKIVGEAIKILMKFTEFMVPLFGNLAGIIGGGLKNAQITIMNWLNNADFSKGLDVFNAGLFAAILLAVRKFINNLSGITNNANGIIKNIKGIFSGIAGVFSELQSTLKVDMVMKIAKALAILTASVVVLSLIDSNKLTYALGAVAILFIELSAAMSLFNKAISGFKLKTITKISKVTIGMTTAILLLSIAVRTMANLNWSELLIGLGGVAGLMGALIVAVRMMPDNKKVLKKAGGLILFASSINILASSVKKLSVMDTNELAKGLIGVGVLLAEIGMFMKYMGDTKHILSTALALTILGTSMLIFSKSIINMGQMTLSEMAIGLTTLAGALTIIGVALKFIQGGIMGASAILIVAAALGVLTPVLKSLGGMEWAEIGKGLVTIAGVLAIIGVSAVVLGPAALAILGLAASILALGTAIALIGGGVLLLSTGLSALSVAGAAGVSSLILIVTGLIGLIPMFLQQVANGLVAFSNIIAQGAPAIVGAISAIFTSILQMLIDTMPKMATVMKLLIQTILDVIVDSVPIVIDAIGRFFKALINAVKDALGINSPSSVFYDIGGNIILGLINGLISGISNVTKTIGKVATSIIDKFKKIMKINSPSELFDEIGRWIPSGLANGIKSNSKVAILATTTMTEDVENAIRDTLQIHSISPKLSDIGGWIPKSVESGIGEEKISLMKTARKLGSDTGDETIGGLVESLTTGESAITKKFGDLLELLSLKKKVKDDLGVESGREEKISLMKTARKLGSDTGDGFVEGFDSTVGQGVRSSSAAASKDAFEIFKEDINKRKEFNVMSMDEEIRLWEEFAKKYAEGTQIRLKADKEIGRLKYENSKRWIDEEKYYKRLSLQDELAAWERVQARYKEGHEYRMQAEREIFRLKQELQNAAHQNSMNWIETERKYGRLNLMRELAAWTRVANNAEYSEEQRKNAEYEIFRVQKEISEKRKALEDDYYNKTKEIKNKLAQDIASLNKAYADAVESRAKTLYNSYRMFDAVEVKEPVDGEQLLTNLEDQVKAFDNWRKQITELGQRGIQEGLMDELEAMGPNSAAEIEALNSLTDEQLTQYVELWQQKHQSARSQAILELEGMRKDTDKQIKQLQNRSADQLSELKDTFNARMKEVSEVTVKWIQIMRGQVDQELRAMNIDIQGQLKQMANGIQNMGSAVVNADNAAYKASRKKFAEDYKEEIAEMAKLHDVDLGVAQAMLENEMRKNGKAAIDGMKAGIKSESNSLVKTTVNTVKPVVTSVKNVLGIKSPSRVLFGLGKHSIGGFINGFGSMMTDVKEVGSQLAQATIESLTPVTSISSILDDMDIDPTITPVLDLTNIKRDSKEIGRLFGGQKVNLSSGAREKAKLFNRPLVPVTTSKENTPAVGTTISYTQNNYSPKALSRIEIYRQTRNQISTLKGLVTSSD